VLQKKERFKTFRRSRGSGIAEPREDACAATSASGTTNVYSFIQTCLEWIRVVEYHEPLINDSRHLGGWFGMVRASDFAQMMKPWH
jgi:hypothetical protein